MTKIEETLKERGDRYGTFDDNAAYAQAIKAVMRKSPNWEKMTDAQREGLDFIASKMGRILSGDPNYTDSWHDIAGFASLVEKSIVARALEIERQEYNRRVDEDAYNHWLWTNTLERATLVVKDPYQKAQPIETGDYDPIHFGHLPCYSDRGEWVHNHSEAVPCPWKHPAPHSEAAGEPNPAFSAVATVVGGEVLGIHPVWPEGEVDEMAPEVFVSRCY